MKVSVIKTVELELLDLNGENIVKDYLITNKALGVGKEFDFQLDVLTGEYVCRDDRRYGYWHDRIYLANRNNMRLRTLKPLVGMEAILSAIQAAADTSSDGEDYDRKLNRIIKERFGA